MYTVLFHALSIPLAIMYSHIIEWVLHKYLLHGVGIRKDSIFSFHWHSHHKNCRKNEGLDPNYDDWYRHFSVWKEIVGLTLLLAIHVILAFYSPFFFITLVFCSVRYFYIHRKAHLDVEWAKKNVPWHYEHHMGKDQNANWGVTTDWVDRAAKTRKHYLDQSGSLIK